MRITHKNQKQTTIN